MAKGLPSRITGRKAVLMAITAVCFAALTLSLLNTCSEIDAADAKLASEQKDQDRRAADLMRVTYEQYEAAKGVSTQAVAACRTEVEQMAKWGAESDWLFNGSWITDGQQITIHAHDVRFKNGFGASSYVKYECSYDIASGNASIISLEDY
jgi:archaellum component FlaF (FlaF/FlaG flagellin family)